MLLIVSDLGFAFAKLLGEFHCDLVDRQIKIVLGILGIEIGAGNREVRFDDIFLRLRVIVQEHDMGRQNAVGQCLEVIDLFRHMSIDGCGEGQMSRAEMNLHN